MADSGRRQIGGVSIELTPHAYDPVTKPELFEGVLARRLIAFLIDLVILSIPILIGATFIIASTVITFGLASIVFALLAPLYWPLIVIWGICYYGFTFGSQASATVGMRVMDLEMRTWYGTRASFLLGAGHAAVFWVMIAFIWPLTLLLGFFNSRKRLPHDILVGTIVISNAARAQIIQDTRQG
jgi:uncharacterized RDD family membrane protein YckC